MNLYFLMKFYNDLIHQSNKSMGFQRSKMDNLLLVLQLCLYSVGVILNFPNNLSDNANAITSIAVYGCSIIFKLVRQLLKNNGKNLIKAQISFLLPYLLTAFLIVFGYYLLSNLGFSQTYIVLQGILFGVNSICYSMVIYAQLQNLAEFIVYLIGEGIIVCYAVSDTVYGVNYLDTLPDDVKSEQIDLAKDYYLLELATYIGLGLCILDLLVRGWEEKMREQAKQKKEEMTKKELEIPLNSIGEDSFRKGEKLID